MNEARGGFVVRDENDISIEIDCRNASEKLAAGADFLLLDCREPSEYECVHLSGATLIPMNDLPARIAELEPHREKEIIVYCHLGMRSLRVATWLRGQGFAQARSITGGIDQWAQEIDPALARY